jgi:hypothetical protein
MIFFHFKFFLWYKRFFFQPEVAKFIKRFKNYLFTFTKK